MAERGWPRHGLSIGLFEFRRTLRSLGRSKRQLIGGLAGSGLPTLGILIAWYFLRGNVPAGFNPADYAVAGMRGQVTVAWLFTIFLVAQRSGSIRPRIDAQSLMLTTVSTRSATVGLWVAETLRVLAYVGTPVILGALAITDLLGTPGVLLTVPLATVLFVASAVTVGSLCGYLAVLAVARIPFVARYKTWLAGSISLLVVAVVFGAQTVIDVDPLLEVLAYVPVGWLIDLAALGTAVQANATLAAVGAAVALGVVVAGGRAIELTTERFWYATPVSPAGTETPSHVGDEADGHWLDDALTAGLSPFPSPAFGPRPTARVATMTVLHTVRNPQRLTILMLPIFVALGPLLGSGVGADGVSVTVAIGAVALLSWLPGGVFALNPLGDQQAVLPTTLIAADPRALVHGIALAGFVYGGPLVVVLTVIAGVAASLSISTVVTLTALAAALAVIAAPICLAVGVILPRFSAISVGQADEVLPPRLSAVIASLALVTLPGGYLASLVVAPETAQTLLAGVVGWLPALVLELASSLLSLPLSGTSAWFAALGERITGVETATFQYGMTGLLATSGVILALAGYRYTVRTVRTFELA